MDQREVRAALAWSALPGFGERGLQRLLEHAREARTTLAALWDAGARGGTECRDLARLVGLDSRTAAALGGEGPERWERAGAEEQEVRSRGVDLLLWGAPDYPPAPEPA